MYIMWWCGTWQLVSILPLYLAFSILQCIFSRPRPLSSLFDSYLLSRRRRRRLSLFFSRTTFYDKIKSLFRSKNSFHAPQCSLLAYMNGVCPQTSLANANLGSTVNNSLTMLYSGVPLQQASCSGVRPWSSRIRGETPASLSKNATTWGFERRQAMCSIDSPYRLQHPKVWPLLCIVRSA